MSRTRRRNFHKHNVCGVFAPLSTFPSRSLSPCISYSLFFVVRAEAAKRDGRAKLIFRPQYNTIFLLLIIVGCKANEKREKINFVICSDRAGSDCRNLCWGGPLKTLEVFRGYFYPFWIQEKSKFAPLDWKNGKNHIECQRTVFVAIFGQVLSFQTKNNRLGLQRGRRKFERQFLSILDTRKI